MMQVKWFLVVNFTGFTAIGDSKFTSDVHWGCMLRSSQMLVAQVLYCVVSSYTVSYEHFSLFFIITFALNTCSTVIVPSS